MSLDIGDKGWGFWDIEKIKEFLLDLQSTNSFISLNSPWNGSLRWAQNYAQIEEDKKNLCIPFASRKFSNGLKTLDDLDPRQLFIDSTVNFKFTPKGLSQVLKLFLQNTPKIALVDRHNYLMTKGGKISSFVEFVREILMITKSSKCHEILIYAKYDPNSYPYMKSNEALLEKLGEVFDGYATPTYGIKYLCCSEYQNNQDLHARRIATNNVVFVLSDSIAGSTYSQSVTRVHDKDFINKNLKDWIDEEHGLEVKTSATFINMITKK